MAAEDANLAVIVQELPGAGDGPEGAVARLGGSVDRQIKLIHGFSAHLPRTALGALRGTAGVRAVTPDARVTLSGMDGFVASADPGSTYSTNAVLGAGRFWARGHTGEGIDVAVLDSGVSPVEGLNAPGKIVNGPDLSFESQDDTLRHLDTYGHGTHMAGIIAGNDSDAGVADAYDATHHRGIAPDARIVSVKVADRGGAADVSQVIAGIDWIVQHRNTDGLNIRVLNLSFGTDGVQDYKLDPLAYAAEAAWRKGIVVVVSGGNAGFGSAKLNNPAYDPYVLAVGASDPKGTSSVLDDSVPGWSSAGDGTRNPDLVAPGKSIVSLRIGGGGIDTMYPEGRIGTYRFFRGSGTSQSAAVVSGGAALLISQRPALKPDQVKAILTASAVVIPNAEARAQGRGQLSLRRAAGWSTPSLASVTQTWPKALGTGSLDAARGTQRLSQDGIALDGERDIFGNAWDGVSWSNNLWNGTSWSGGNWNGVTWTGSSWTGSSWTGSSWTGSSWTGSSWTGSSWTGSSWTGSSWSGSSWTGSSWSGSSWSSAGWGS
jgi:serine protease AprX